jgi:hypothetical protein
MVSAQGGAGGTALDAGGTAGAGGAGGSTGGASDASPVTPPPNLPRGNLDTDLGCSGVFNPDQLLEFRLAMASGDWAAILADTTYSKVVQARFRCNGGPELVVGVRRKRSGGQQKVGLKIDINEIAAGQQFYGLKKLSLENGVSSGDNTDSGDVGGLIREYLGWRMMVLSGAVSGRAAMVRLEVNGAVIGVYVNVEQVDKTFLESRLGNDGGWLYKKSGGIDDGLKTHELDMLDNPFDNYFCFFAKGGGSCAMPSATVLARDLPGKLNIPQMLRMGAVNALIANSDSPLFKDNNYYFYDWAGGPRLYLPWDLDTTMNANVDVFTGGVGGQVSYFTAALFSNWTADYKAILQELLSQKLTQTVIFAELARVERAAGVALDADPHAGGTTTAAVSGLQSWWKARLPAVQMQLATH